MVPSCTYIEARQWRLNNGKKCSTGCCRLSNMNSTVSWVLESHYSSCLDEDTWLVMCRYVTSKRAAWSTHYWWRCSLHVQTTDCQRTNSSCHSKLLSVDSNILKLCDTIWDRNKLYKAITLHTQIFISNQLENICLVTFNLVHSSNTYFPISYSRNSEMNLTIFTTFVYALHMRSNINVLPRSINSAHVTVFLQFIQLQSVQ